MRIILDGNNLAYRARSSSMVLTKKDGTDVTAIYGVLKMLQSYLKPSGDGFKNHIAKAVQSERKLEMEPQFTQVFMCWDGGKSRYRKEIYPDYKGHREKKKKEKSEEEKQQYYQFLKQMDLLHESLPNLGVHSIKEKGWEADDLVYIIDELLDDDINIVVSTDRDLLQLVDETTYVWSPFKEQLITPANFTEVTGVPKAQYLHYRIMVGDTSDNINGILGIGDKKARALLLRYNDLPTMMSDEVTLRKSKVTSRLFDDMDILLRNLKLMDLSASPYKDEGLDDIIREVLSGDTVFNPALTKSFFMSNEFISLVAEFERWSSPFKGLSPEIRYREE